MNLYSTPHGLRPAARLRVPLPWLKALIAIGLLLLPVGQAQADDDVTIEGPIVRQRVAPQLQTTNLLTLMSSRPAKVWQPGDPVQIMEDLKRIGPAAPQQGEEAEQRPLPAGDPVQRMPDLQRSETGGASMSCDFDGISATGFVPPDTVGAVGPAHYIQAVNAAFAIYDKNGNLLAGPSPINSLWNGFGGPCEADNNGDPIVRYDHLANRWLISQFAVHSPPDYRQCIAISRTDDPIAGGWHLYAFPTDDSTGNPVNPDYPKIGVWPDGYYMGTQRWFPNGGLDVWAFEREQMLAGAPAAVVQFFVNPPSLFLMPSDLDGPPPPVGTPNFFSRPVDGDRFGGVDRLQVFAFQVDWVNHASSSFDLLSQLPTEPFDSVLCSASLLDTCIPQPGTAQLLETLSVWAMWRLQYRNFGTHETLVTNHTVDANGQSLAGIRWYELRRPAAGTWSIFQQGTYAPDSVNRWMGSLAMNQNGSIALGFSASNKQVFPSIRYASRKIGDPLGLLTQERTLVTGGGSQTSSSSRWGNYSSMDVDPVDDCTFWYTTEYYDTTSTAGWRTCVSNVSPEPCIPQYQALAGADPALSDQNGWNDAANYSTIQTAAVGDDLYLLARANAGMNTWKFNPDDKSYQSLAAADPPLSDQNGWNDATNYSTIQTAVVGDDLFLLARANAGMNTWKFNPDDNSYQSLAAADPPLSDQNGWNDEANYSTIQTAVVGGDLFLLARANAGMNTWKFNPDDNSYQSLAAADPPLSDQNGWNDAANFSTIQTAVVGGDLFLLARANAGMNTWKFNPDDNSYQSLAAADPPLSDQNGWNDAANYSTIQTAVVGDDLFLLARANAGLITWKFDPKENGYQLIANDDPAWSDGLGWSDVANYATIQTAVVAEQLFLLARAGAGMNTLSLISTAGHYQPLVTANPPLSDQNGWNDAGNYATIQTVVVGDQLFLLARADAGMDTWLYVAP